MKIFKTLKCFCYVLNWLQVTTIIYHLSIIIVITNCAHVCGVVTLLTRYYGLYDIISLVRRNTD